VSDAAGQQAQQMGNNMVNAGAQLNRLALDAIDQANQVRVNDAVNQAVQSRLKLTYAPGEGFVHLKGNDALARPDGKPLDQEYSDKYEQQIASIGESLGNDAQRRAFQMRASDLMTQFRGSLTQHVAKEYGDYQVGVQEGTVKTNIQQMALGWGDPNTIKSSQDAIRAAVAEQGRIMGWSGVQSQAATVNALSPGNLAVIQGAVDGGKLDYAREYLKQNNEFLTPEARLHVTKMLDVGDFEKRTQEKADAIYGQFGGDMTAALSEVRSTMSGKDEDAVVTRLKTLDAERVALRERNQKDAADKAWRIYADTGGLGKIPPSLLAAMDGRDVEALKRTARVNAEGREVKTDSSIYYALTMASASDPKFKDEDLRRYRDKLSPADFKHFVDLQGKAVKGEDAAQVATATQQKESMVKTLGLEKQEAGLFHQEADKALFAAQVDKGRALDQAERQKVLDGLVLEGESPGKYWGSSSTRAFKARAEGKAFTPVWNDTQKNKATAALKRQGITNPTDQQIDATLRAVYGN
jgi:hypothetical protein